MAAPTPAPASPDTADTPIAVSGMRPFLVHLGEMAVIMMLGMVAGAAVFTFAASPFAGRLLTWDEARLAYPAACLLTMGAVMSVPMVTWMRHRGHGWTSGGEMVVAMLVPAIALIALHRAGALAADPLCGIYCALMFPAMAVAMLLRRGDYVTSHGHHPARA